MSVIFINHTKSQCGVYEIGKRIFELIDQNTLPVKYFETSVNGLYEYLNIVEKEKPNYILYNYFSVTLPYVNKELFKKFPKIKHIGIIHDPLTPQMIDFYNTTFDCWVIHDTTNKSISKNKFTTVRPIRRFDPPKKKKDGVIKIGSHGFSVSPWKMFDKMIELINYEFDEVIINMNITQATFGGYENPNRFDNWKKLINKKNVTLNITNTYFESEFDLIDYLSKNDLNVYFYSPPHQFVGVGGSADLAVSSQSSLVVNNTYMYRHFHNHIGYFEQTNNLTSFLTNNSKVKELYELWSPERMTNDYKKMIESL
jgi:hypothetical protein